MSKVGLTVCPRSWQGPWGGLDDQGLASLYKDNNSPAMP